MLVTLGRVFIPRGSLSMLRSSSVLSLFLFTSLAVFVSATAQAEPLFTVQQGAGALDYNMLFNGGLPSSGNLIQARTNGGNAVLDVTSASSLSVLGGHAGFQGSDGPLGDIMLSPSSNPPAGFTAMGELNSIIFSLQAIAEGTLSITALMVDDNSVETSDTQLFNFGANGQQWFQVTATDGYRILELELETLINGVATPLINSFGHIRVELAGPGGVSVTPPVIFTQLPPVVTHSPEPASLALWSLLLLGGAGAAYRPRWRRRS